ncbi:chalcone isomerase, partial [Pyronema omphalodes]
GVDLVPSGTTSVPAFPGTLRLETGLQGSEKGEYHLVGLGIRTVSFLNIQVYVLGFYVHGEDFEELQKEVLKVLGEKSPVTEEEKLRVRKRLLDTKEGEEVWEKVLSEGRWRSVVRIVPTRNTDFQHLRDGWVRGIQARSTKQASYDDEAFMTSLSEFKALFGGAFKKSVPKQKTLLLCRGKQGEFSAYYDPTGRNDGKFGGEGEEKLQTLGSVKDPRISKALWLCYLAGAKPASAPARESIMDGVLGMAKWPVETARA